MESQLGEVPLHLDVTNESMPYMMNPKQDREEEMTKCIKKMESVFYKKELDSQASSNSSRKSSVVNVLMSFSDNYFIPFYGYIMGLFLAVLILAIVGNSVSFMEMNLGWDNSVALKNPLVNVMDMMSLRQLVIKTMNHQMDLSVYQDSSSSLINQTTVNSFYGIVSGNYEDYVKDEMRRIQADYRDSVSSISMFVAELLRESFEKSWE
jgi:hypothetical protein